MLNSSLKCTWIALLACELLVGCSTSNLYPDVGADTRVLVRQWTRPTRDNLFAGEKGSEFSSAVLWENTLIFGSTQAGIISLYPGSNQIRWHLDIPTGVQSELLAQGGSVYFGGSDGYFYSVSADTGKVQWKADLHQSLFSRPMVQGGRVFVATADDGVQAFDAGSGDSVWQYRRRSSVPQSIHGVASPIAEGDTLVAGMSDGTLVGLAMSDGHLIWEKRLQEGAKFVDIDAEPKTSDGLLFVPSYDGSLNALDRKTRQSVWKFPSGGSKNVLIDGPRLYLPSNDGNIYCLLKATGKEIWKFQLDGGVPTGAVIAGRFLIFGSSYQYLYALDLESGRVMYRYHLGSGNGFTGSPTWDKERSRVYILSGNGNLLSFLVRPDQKVWPAGSIDGYSRSLDY